MSAHMDAESWMPPSGTTGLIFDCDGTLADTMPVHYVAWTAMLEPYGIAFPEPRFYALGGMPTEGIIRLLAGEQGIEVDDLAHMSKAKEGHYLQMLDRVQPVHAVLGIAQRLHGSAPMAVASGGERWVVEKTLDIISARTLFETVVGADDTERHKPEPDVFLEAARRIDADPVHCVVFEDTDLGLEAARRAGMHGVDIRHFLHA